MKRLGVLLLILAVVLCVCLLGPRMFRKIGADLGSFSGNSDYGSDYGSDSGWDSGSDYGSGGGFYFFPMGSSGSGGSDSGGFGSLLFWVVLILIVIMILSRMNQHPSTPHAGAAAGAARTPDSQLTPMSEYAALDPNFSVSDMQEKLSNIYVQMQNGCTARNIEPLRPYFTDALYQQFDRQIKSLLANRRINYVDRIAVLDVNLRGFFQEGGDDHLVAELKTRITDYTVAEDTGAVLSGSKTAEKFMTYET